MTPMLLLTDDDLVLSTDWCRPLALIAYESGEVPDRSPYSGVPQNNLLWTRAKHVLGDVWFTPLRTVRQLRQQLGAHYEFVRITHGDMPARHRLSLRGYNTADCVGAK